MTTTEIPTPPETPLQRHAREMREAQERLAAEAAKDPQARAMRDALKLTHGESERLAKAETKLSEAEQAVGPIAAGVLMVLGIGLFGIVTATITGLVVRSSDTSADDPLEQVRRLFELAKAGAITPEEYEAKKAGLLARV